MVRKEFSNLTRTAKRKSKTAKKQPRGAKTSNGKPAECHDLFRNLSEYLDGRIETPNCDRMREHIDACPACIAFIRDLRSAIDRCRSMEVPCSSKTALRLRALLTREYLRMLETAGNKKP